MSAVVSVFLAGCIDSTPESDAEAEGDDADALQTRYVELGDFVTSDADIERWREIRQKLDAGFDDVCGDTFCEGDYTNLQSLGFTCSVSSKQGRIRECVWTFAASNEAIDAGTGAIAADIPFFECRFRPTGKVSGLLQSFGDDPLRSTLPGADTSIYDALGDCFNHPIDATALPAPVEGPYVGATDLLEGESIDAWYAMTHALAAEFDSICGDSFCEGDYTNLEALRFSCSTNTETQKLGTCAWTFAGSANVLRHNGFVRVEGQPFTCSFTVDATPAELASALAPSSEGSVLYRALPGATTSINDALIDCL